MQSKIPMSSNTLPNQGKNKTKINDNAPKVDNITFSLLDETGLHLGTLEEIEH